VPRYVALLRGVNVGKAKRVPMADWRAGLEALGCTDVQTLLNSGNAVFTSKARSVTTLAESIRARLLEDTGVDAAVVVKSAEEVRRIAAVNPFAKLADDPSRLIVAFASQPQLIRDLAPIAALAVKPERMELTDDAGYLWCASGILESKAANALLGKAGRAVTTRNWATVQKIIALL